MKNTPANRRKLMAEIERKVARRKQAREDAIYAKTAEGIVFDFFENFDHLISMKLDPQEFRSMYKSAWRSMADRIRALDKDAKIVVSYIKNQPDSEDFDYEVDNKPQRVTVQWSQSHQKTNGGVESTAIDVSHMLFF